MIENRQLPVRDYLALKAATHDLVRRAGGPTKAASATRGTASLLSRYGAEHEDMFAPLDMIADLEAEAGDPIVTRALADLAGFVLVPKSAAEKPVETIDRAVAEMMHTTGAAVVGIAEALSDGICTPREAVTALPLVKKAIEAETKVLNALEARALKAVRS